MANDKKNRQIERLKEELNLTQKLFLSNRQLYSQLSLLDIVQVMEEILRKFVGAASGAIFVSNEIKLEPLHRFGSIPQKFFIDDKGSLSLQLINRVMQSGREFINKEYDTELPIVCCPLKGKDEILGAVVIYSLLPTKPEIDQSDKKFFSLIADQAGIALQSAIFFEEMELQRTKLQSAYDQLKELDQLKSDFVRMVSHELKTAVTILKSSLSLLETLKLSAEKQKKVISGAKTALSRLMQGMDAQLTLSKIESAKMEYHIQPVQVVNLVSQSIKPLKSLALVKSLNIENKISEKMPLVMADPEKVIQILTHLIHNAIKFTSSGGKISIFSRVKDDVLEISVRDTGVGISKKEQLIIFEQYKQAGKTREVGGGIGLGLPVVNLLVKAHGGTIKVESEENKGSCFSFTLPLAKVMKKAA